MTTPELSDTPLEAVAPSNVDYTLRDRVMAAVERLEALAVEIIAELDRLQGEPDLEDGGDLEDGADHEPSLGAANPRPWASQARWGGDGDETHDLEEQCEDEGAQDDREPDDSGMVPDYGEASESRSVRTGASSGCRDDRRARALGGVIMTVPESRADHVVRAPAPVSARGRVDRSGLVGPRWGRQPGSY